MQNRYKNPYSMDRITYPSSDAELETWVEQTIQREIARGRMLQDQKSLLSERSNKVSIFIPKLANGRTISKCNKRGHIRSKSPLMKNARMRSSVSHDDSASSYKSPRLGRPVCSMRISELAAPTKRQCMASWRANATILPEIMINRLKQRVTDQEPIVKVSDAVNCLKHKRRSSDKSNTVIITPSKRSSRKIKTEAMTQKIQAQYKDLSDAFGIKIAELLMKPMVITLNPQLKNISHIITDEIYNIIKDTATFKTDKTLNKEMLQKTAEKVTIWVAKILEDSSEKLLEEELRELEEQEGPVLDVLDDFVDSVLHKCIKTPSDILTPEYLSITSEDIDKNDAQETDHQTVANEASHGDEVSIDEEAKKNTIESDILKQLNDVIHSVTQDNLEKPSIVLDDHSTGKGENNREPDRKSETNIPSDGSLSPDTNRKSETNIPSDGSVSPDTNINSEPNIDVLYTHSNDTPVAMPDGDDNDDEHDENIIENISQLSDTNDGTIPFITVNENKGDEEMEDNTLLAPEDNNVTDTNEEQSSNVSGVIEIITEELSEGKNKTVQFSKENLDSIADINKEQNNQFNRKNVHLEEDQLLENIALFERPRIEFAPPNEELLSDADESWPETLPITKPSASVTRSITSMGRLIETDEVFSTVLEDATEYLLQTTDSKHLEDDNDENNQQITLDPKETGDLRGNLGEIVDLESGRALPYVKGIDVPPTPTPHDFDPPKPEIDNTSAIFSLEPTVISVRKDASLILIRDEDLVDPQVSEHIIWESDISKHNNLQSPRSLAHSETNDYINEKRIAEELLISQKFDYRVHLKTAPAWIRRGQGEPNGSPCVCRPPPSSGADITDPREREIRKRCQDLDLILKNLDKWKTRLNYISKYITDLKRNAGKVNKGRQRSRSPSRTEEATSWRQLHKRATEGLQMRRQEETVKFKIPSPPVKYCRNCGRRKQSQMKRHHHQNNIRNSSESKCKRHNRRNEPSLRKN